MLRRVRQLLAGLVVLGILALAWKLWPRERSLLAYATPILKADSCMTDWDNTYAWVSDHALVFCRDLDTAKPYAWTLFYRDIRTGAESKLAAATERFDATRDSGTGFLASPDGQSLLWWNSAGDVFSCALNGSRYAQSPGNFMDSNVHWMSDNRHWLLFESSHNDRIDQARIYSSDASQQARIVPLDSELTAWFNSVSHLVGFKSHQPITAQNRMLMTYWTLANQKVSELGVLELSVGGTITLLHQYSVRLPSYTNVEVYAPFSLGGKRVAWLLVRHPLPVWYSVLHRWLPIYQLHPRYAEEIWVSNSDGSQMHEVGSIDEVGMQAESSI